MPAFQMSKRSISHPFDVTKDPFAIFGFILLILSIIVATIVLTIVSRRSAESEWDFVKRTKIVHPRLRKLVLVEEGLPLMSQQLPIDASESPSLPAKPSKAAQKAAKTVRFSCNFELDQASQDVGRSSTSIANSLEPDFEDVDLGDNRRQTLNERQIAEMHLSN